MFHFVVIQISCTSYNVTAFIVVFRWKCLVPYKASQFSSSIHVGSREFNATAKLSCGRVVSDLQLVVTMFLYMSEFFLYLIPLTVAESPLKD